MGVAPPAVNKYICFNEVKSLISYAWKANKSFYLTVIKNLTALLKFLFTYIISFGWLIKCPQWLLQWQLASLRTSDPRENQAENTCLLWPSLGSHKPSLQHYPIDYTSQRYSEWEKTRDLPWLMMWLCPNKPAFKLKILLNRKCT